MGSGILAILFIITLVLYFIALPAKTCETCEGTGSIGHDDFHDIPCRKCNGEGYID